MDKLSLATLGERRPSELPSDAIRLPAETPPPNLEEEPEDFESRPTAEQISKNELRLIEESKDAPVPSQVLDAAPMLKASLVAPVQVNGKMFQDFLEALSSVAKESLLPPILRNVRVTYTEGELQLEATDERIWLIAKMKAHGGRDGFECMLPLKRALNVVRRIVASYSSLCIGVDVEEIHIGPYSFPHGGKIGDYPRRMTLQPEELKVVLPVHYIDCILKRLAGVVDPDHDKACFQGVRLDFNEGVAVATDGKRLHMLTLKEIQISTRRPHRTRPAVTVPVEVFTYLRAVADRQWVGLVVNEKLLTAFGEDFGVLVRPLEGSFGNWRGVVPSYTGYWVVDKEALIETLKDAQPLQSGYVKLAVDSIGDKLIVTARGPQGDTYRHAVTAYRRGGPPTLQCGVNPQFLRYAIEATEGGLVHLGFDDQRPETNPITVSGEKDDFQAVVMPYSAD